MGRQPVCMWMAPAWKESLERPFLQHSPVPNSISWKRCWHPDEQIGLVRSLIRRIIVTRPTPDTVEARVVWVSGAVTPFSVHPPISRGSDVSGYEHLVERILTLGA